MTITFGKKTVEFEPLFQMRYGVPVCLMASALLIYWHALNQIPEELPDCAVTVIAGGNIKLSGGIFTGPVVFRGFTNLLVNYTKFLITRSEIQTYGIRLENDTNTLPSAMAIFDHCTLSNYGMFDSKSHSVFMIDTKTTVLVQ